MAKKKSILDWLMIIVGIIVALGIGGLFIKGGFTGVIILSYLPLIIHQIVGWSIIIVTIWGIIKGFK